ncbi:sugar transferase [Virgibacillus sp. YIM 98842]|uniref:sugar transferase n=1 Tax=Virgibacillus sp. YIM 98842 TaxID=2663533 RepID=UPI0013DA2271|nr:sugar transferase [Virgibacillus sp. YIM 98842]
MYRSYIKRMLDLLTLLLVIIPLLILGIIISVLIKIDSKGKILFKQNRLGQYGRVFKIYKFRTMIQDAEKVGTGVFTSDEDPRITKIGRLLRKTSLDELPQIINILKGEMSFVGPRPPVPYHPYKYEDYTDTQRLRFTVKPGVTGMAQAYGRNTLSWDERIEYDVKYVKNISLLLDIKIVIKTILSVIRKENIYRESGK